MRLKAVYLLIVTYFFLNNSIHAQSPGQLKEVLSSSTSHFANNLEFSKDGNYMVLVVGFNADVYQKKENGFQLVQTIRGGTWQAYNPGISYDGTFICFSNYEDTYVYKRTGESYSLFQTIKHPGKSVNKDLIMRFDENDKLMIIGGEGNIRYYELSGTSFYESKRISNKENLVFQNAALSPNGKVLATIDVNGVVHCWQLTADNAIKGNVLLKTNKYTGMLDVSDDLLLVAGETDSLNIYQVSKDLNSISKFFQFPEGKFGEVNFNPDGNRVMVSDKSSQLYLYKIINNVVSLESVNRLDRDNFTSFKTNADGKWLAASSSGGKMIKIFEAPAPIAKTKSSSVNAKTKPDDKKIKPVPVVVANTKTKAALNSTGVTVIVSRKSNGKYILVDSVSRKPFSEIEYEEAGKSKSGLIYLMKNGHYGIARKDGQILMNPDTSKFRFIIDSADKAGNYMGLLFDAKRKNLIGDYVLVNKQFVQITSHSYNFIMDFKDGFYQPYQRIIDAKNSVDLLFGLLTKEGKELLKPVYKLIKLNEKDKLIHVYTPDYKQGLYDYAGKVILPDEFNRIDIDYSGNKNILISKNGMSGFIDKKGKTIIPLKYSSISYMDYGVNSYYDVTLDGKHGIVNLACKEIIRPEYKFLYAEFEEGCDFFYASRDGIKEGWVDKTGKIILPLFYTDGLLCPGKEGLSRAKISDTSYVFVNKKGQIVFNKKFQDASHFQNGIAFVKEKGKYGFINTKGIYIIQSTFDRITMLYDNSGEKNHLYAVEKNGKCGFMDKTANLIIPNVYDTLGKNHYYDFADEELIAVKQNNKWGFIDRTGKVIVPLNYDIVSGFKDGEAEVELKGETFYIDKKGVRVKK